MRLSPPPQDVLDEKSKNEGAICFLVSLTEEQVGSPLSIWTLSSISAKMAGEEFKT